MGIWIHRGAAFVALAAYLLATSACSSSSGGGEGGTGSAAAQACRDTADAIASAAQRCGQNYQQNYDAFVDAAALGDCNNIVQVRDASGLYDVCIPFMKNLTCEQLNDENLVFPGECQDQLLREA